MIAVTHEVSPAFEQGERTFIGRAPTCLQTARLQHAAYQRMLADCGIALRTLSVNNSYPDGCFCEDTAVVLDEVAISLPLGAASRAGEATGIAAELRAYRPVVRIEPPAALEGGDVLRIGRRLFVGRSHRSNDAGIDALRAIAEPLGYRVCPVTVCGCLHLKTAACALDEETILANPAWLDVTTFQDFDIVAVPQAEPFAANVLLLQGIICQHAGFVRTLDLIASRGHEVRSVDVSEFQKAEGGLTCLSILIP
jgi:dimethylargininase